MNLNSLSIGLVNPKSADNVGSIIRAAGCFGVSSIFYSGQRYGYARQHRTDTNNAADKIPVIGCADLRDMVPRGATVVGVELVEGATPLPQFTHPDNAFYVFGPEDGSLPASALQWCDEVVYIPTTGCLNLGATANIVLYDRAAKSVHTEMSDALIKQSRDTNNRLVWPQQNR